MGQSKKAVRWLVRGAAIACTLAVAACGSSGGSGSGSSSGGGSGSGSKGGHPKITLRVAFTPATTDPTYIASKRWAAAVSAATHGGLTLKLYPNGQLGSDDDVEKQAAAGASTVALTTPTFLGQYVPDMNILGGPLLFTSLKQESKVTNSSLVKGWENTIAQKHDLHVLALNWFFGERVLITNKHVSSPSSLSGLKMRVPADSPMFNNTYQVLKAVPTPLETTDIYTSLKQGVIDGADFPLPSINALKLTEVAKHINLVPLFFQMNGMAMSEKVWNSMPASYQKALSTTAIQAGNYASTLVTKQSNQAETQLKAAGIDIQTPSAAQLSAFTSATKPVYTKFSDWTPGLYNTIVKLRGH